MEAYRYNGKADLRGRICIGKKYAQATVSVDFVSDRVIHIKVLGELVTDSPGYRYAPQKKKLPDKGSWSKAQEAKTFALGALRLIRDGKHLEASEYIEKIMNIDLNWANKL